MKFWYNNSFERDVGYAGASPTPLKLSVGADVGRHENCKYCEIVNLWRLIDIGGIGR